MRLVLERPAPPCGVLDGAIVGPTFCDGEDSWQPGCGFCATCGGRIEATKDRLVAGREHRSRWFCSGPRRRDCEHWWQQNHQWPPARAAALHRDRSCTRCHAGDVRSQGQARRAGRRPSVHLEVNHKRALADTEVARHAGAAVRLTAMQYGTGCQHHQDGLETLCSGCHHAETARQGQERAARRGTAERTEAIA